MNSVVKDFLSGSVVSLVAIAFYLSSAALLFQDSLAPHLAEGIGSVLFGAALLAVFQAARGSIALASVGAEPATVPVLATMTATLAAQSTAANAFPTAMAALGIAALCIGLTWFALGRLGVGDVIRYIPYPVIGGFLASIGWLMLSGGLGVVMGESFTLNALYRLLTSVPPAPVVVALVFAAILWWATLNIRHVMVLPGLIVAAILLIHLWLGLTGIDLQAARNSGWLGREISQTVPTHVLLPQHLGLIDWGLIAGQSGAILSAVIISVIALLLSDSSLEVAFDERADFNRDLKVLGLGNVAVGLLGGLTGGISISRSILNRQAGAAGRWSGAVKAGICLLAMFAGGPLISLIPKAVLGGILMYIGLGMLKTWLIDGARRLGKSDYLAILTMLALTIFAGYLPAVVVGVVVCCFDFAVSSARLGPIRRTFSRNDWPGRVERSAKEQAILSANGERLRIVELQGALFFGSIRTLADDLESILAPDRKPDRLVIDFKRVHWMDSSAAQAMMRVIKVATRSGVPVTFSHAGTAVEKQLRAGGCIYSGGPELMEDIDHAITQWEDHQLQDVQHSDTPLEDWLQGELGSAGAVQELLGWLEVCVLAPGEVLFSENQAADSLYLVQTGRLSASVGVRGKIFKIRSIQAGGTVGEMGLYRQGLRSATVTADVPSQVLRMRQSTLEQIEAQAPALAQRLHRLFVRLLAARLEHANAQSSALAA